MLFLGQSVALAVGIIVSLMIFMEVGYRRGIRRREVQGQAHGIATVDGAIFALVSFVIAFGFSGAQSRLETRRAAIVAEANAIWSSYLLVDLTNSEAKAELREAYRSYANARVRAAESLPDLHNAKLEWEKSHQISERIWQLSRSSTKAPVGAVDRGLVLSGVNAMLSCATSREIAALVHMPTEILVLLGVLAGIVIFLAGESTSRDDRRPVARQILLVLLLSAVLSVLLDLEHPRSGFIRVGEPDLATQSVLQMIERTLAN